jgi:hypothetical protein
MVRCGEVREKYGRRGEMEEGRKSSVHGMLVSLLLTVLHLASVQAAQAALNEQLLQNRHRRAQPPSGPSSVRLSFNGECKWIA